MPTGYTHKIADGITFKEYAMGCARAFGALITMRDDPQDAEIPEEFETSNYHKDAIEEETAKLKELLEMDNAAAEQKAKQSYDESVLYHRKGIEKDKQLKLRYEAMLAEVEKYQSPSREHDNFKEFMATQIYDSIRFDCNSTYHHEALKSLELQSGEEWIAAERERLESSIEYHTEAYKKEVDGNNKRNEWVRKLRESLNSF